MQDRTLTLDFAERWLRDGISVCRPPAFSQSLEVDMTRAKHLLDIAKGRGLRLTYTHLIVRAAALVLAANPELHVLVCGARRRFPAQVDIGLSLAGDMFLTPVLIIADAARKSLPAIAEEITRRTPEAQEESRAFAARLRRWGPLIPFGFLRRALLRILGASFSFRQKGSGTFQVSIVPGVDRFDTPLFNTSAILTAGAVRERVVAVNGVPAVGCTVWLTCSADHRVWNGSACETFLLRIREILQGSTLEDEFAAEATAKFAHVRYE